MCWAPSWSPVGSPPGSAPRGNLLRGVGETWGKGASGSQAQEPTSPGAVLQAAGDPLPQIPVARAGVCCGGWTSQATLAHHVGGRPKHSVLDALPLQLRCLAHRLSEPPEDLDALPLDLLLFLK